jgi:hypothetical protein
MYQIPRWPCRQWKVVGRAIALLLVPAVVLGGIPQSLCVCAGNEVLRLCASRTCCQRRSEPAPAAGCHCPCCAAKCNLPRPCCSRGSVHPATREHAKPLQAQSVSQVGGTCCQQQVATPAPAAVEKTDPWVPAMAVALLPAGLEVAGPRAASAAERGNARLRLPPLNRVVWFLHLTI